MSRQERVTSGFGDNHNTVIFIMKLWNLQQLLLYTTQNLHFDEENNFCCCQTNHFTRLVERCNACSDKPQAYGTSQCPFCKTTLNINQEEDAK